MRPITYGDIPSLRVEKLLLNLLEAAELMQSCCQSLSPDDALYNREDDRKCSRVIRRAREFVEQISGDSAATRREPKP